MDQVINAALSFPAVIFTVLMGFCLIFWTTVIMGGADPNSLDPDVHADVDGDLHADVHAHVDAHGHVDADGHHHDVDGDIHHGSLLNSLLGFMNVGSVPLSMIASAGVLFGWVSTMLIQIYVQPTLLQMMPAVAAGMVTLCASGAGSMVAAGLLTRPLRGAFKIQTFLAGDALIDHPCRITSSRVDAAFGEARYEMKGAPLVLSVRCRQPNKLVKGADAVIVSYDAKTNIYEVGELETKDEDVEEIQAAADAALKGKKVKSFGKNDIEG
jgi:hypothetical protein